MSLIVVQGNPRVEKAHRRTTRRGHAAKPTKGRQQPARDTIENEEPEKGSRRAEQGTERSEESEGTTGDRLEDLFLRGIQQT